MKKLDPTMAEQVAQAVSVFQAAADWLPAQSGDRGAERGHAGRHAARGAVARGEGYGLHAGGGRSGTGVPPAALQETPPTCCGRRSDALPGSRWARQPRKLRRRPAPSYMRLRPARWCRCSSLPAGSRRRPGTEVDETIHHKKRRFCHVSSIEEESGVGGDRRRRWRSSPAEGHGAGNSRHERETGLRG